MPPYPTVTMRNGDRGDHVRQLQALLNRDYPAYSKLTEDGEFGPKTEAVIREFQRRAGLSVTGVADSWTLAKLDELTVQHGGGGGGGGGGEKECGDGIYVSPSTSCEFAHNVRQEYFRVPGASVEIHVYSPVTNQTYTMACVQTDNRITCRGGNNAVVTFYVG
jgi:peptidoglycan hydrolase-like protein with peptidoglycan-binding domain